jgi:cytochrome c biogenesis protein CcmG, thiol:disulfide interchange protein DsbE
MRRFAVPGFIAAVAVGVLVVLAIAISGQNGNNSIDSQVSRGHFPVMPDAKTSLPVLGKDVKASIASMHGKVVLVNVFAGWCVSCYQEAPVLKQAEAMLKAKGGTVVGVTYQDSSNDAEKFVKKYGVTYPVLHDASDSLATALDVTAVPESFIVNRQGKIQALQRNEITESWLNKNLPKILSEKA